MSDSLVRPDVTGRAGPVEAGAPVRRTPDSAAERRPPRCRSLFGLLRSPWRGLDP